ncbi:MAG: hypothetical protein ACYTA5_08670 [Planctomycetota bacterium]
MTNLVLRLFDYLAWAIKGAGIDYAQFRAILELKLTMDGRRTMGTFDTKPQKKAKNKLGLTVFTYTMMGFFVGAMTLIIKNPFISMTLVYAFIMTMTALALIADFSSVILDSTDNAIFLPRPIGGRTILAARIAHISTYLSLIVLSLSLGTLVIGVFSISVLFPIVFLATLVCSTTMVLCLVSIFYLLAARMMNVERLKDIILYFQILMTVVVIGGYQIIPRLLTSNLQVFDSSQIRWWFYLIPPAWMAAPIDMLAGSVGVHQLALTILAVGVPALSLFVLIYKLAPRFHESLSVLESDSGPATKLKSSSTRFSLLAGLAPFISRDSRERAAFELTLQLCSRDRKFKLRTYPGFAMVLIVSASFLLHFGRGQGFSVMMASLRESKTYLVLLYIGCMMIATCIVYLKYSDRYEAAWFYHVLPFRVPGVVLMGAFKAVLLRFVLPINILLAVVTFATWGAKIWLDVIVSVCVTLLISLVYALIIGRRFPFSEKFAVTETSGIVVLNMLPMFLVAAIGGLHYILISQPLLLGLFALIVLIVSAFLMRVYARTSWKTLQQLN